jgi:hypothetical protein
LISGSIYRILSEQSERQNGEFQVSDTLLNIEGRAPSSFAVGQSISDAFGVLTSHFFLFLSVSAIANLPLLYLYYQMALHRGEGRFEYILLETLSEHVFGALCQAMVVFATFQHLRNKRVQILDSVSHGLAPFASVIGTSLLVTIIVAIGTILLFVPGIIASTMLSVAIPVCVVERVGPLRSLSRSRNLTDGYKGSIFGVYFAIGIANWILSFAVGASFSSRDAAGMYAVALYTWLTLVTCFISIVSTVIYHGLRSTKEGIDIHEIAAVFD